MRITKANLEFFEEKLLDFGKKSGRHELPWRKKGITAYEVWVSEIMLQQTQVSRVIDYYTRFLKRFPTVQKLARATWEEFLPYYEGLGYYQRGRNMLRAAKMIVDQHAGVFPKNKSELIALPGIGEYSAAAILSFAYQKPLLAWDTNLKRVIGRVFYGSKAADIDRTVFDQRLIRHQKLNAALMDFGSAICAARPKCAACMLKMRCDYYQTHGKKEVVSERRTVPFRLSEARAEVFLHENHRRYFSSLQSRYQPFRLPPAYNSRAGIKEWFQKQHGLSVSVRPPHKRILREGAPMIWVNAQILRGRPQFREFFKSAVTEYTRNTEKI